MHNLRKRAPICAPYVMWKPTSHSGTTLDQLESRYSIEHPAPAMEHTFRDFRRYHWCLKLCDILRHSVRAWSKPLLSAAGIVLKSVHFEQHPCLIHWPRFNNALSSSLLPIQWWSLNVVGWSHIVGKSWRFYSLFYSNPTTICLLVTQPLRPMIRWWLVERRQWISHIDLKDTSVSTQRAQPRLSLGFQIQGLVLRVRKIEWKNPRREVQFAFMYFVLVWNGLSINQDRTDLYRGQCCSTYYSVVAIIGWPVIVFESPAVSRYQWFDIDAGAWINETDLSTVSDQWEVALPARSASVSFVQVRRCTPLHEWTFA